MEFKEIIELLNYEIESRKERYNRMKADAGDISMDDGIGYIIQKKIQLEKLGAELTALYDFKYRITMRGKNNGDIKS